MGKYVTTFIEKIQTDKPIDNIGISVSGLTAILKNKEELEKNGLQEIREKLQPGEILDNRVFNKDQNDFQASKTTHIFYKESYKAFSEIIKTLHFQNNDDVCIHGKDGTDKLGLANEIAKYFKNRNMFSKGIFMIDPDNKDQSEIMKKKIIDLIPNKKRQMEN